MNRRHDVLTIVLLAAGLYVSSATRVVAQCPSADKFVEQGLYDELKITKAQTLREDFRSWFFSTTFEQQIKNSGGGLSITVPFKGVPITFGGRGETANAWTIRNENAGSSDWSFDQQMFEQVYSRVAPDKAREVWLKAIEACYSAASRLRASSRSTATEVIATLSYVQGDQEAVPIIVGFACGAALRCDDANSSWRGLPMRIGGIDVIFPWVGTEMSGVVSLNTTRGSVQIAAKRPPVVNKEVLVTYLTSHTELERTGARETDYVVFNVGGQKCKGSFCSPDGKWQAGIGFGRLEADPGNELRNARTWCVAGPCPWSSTDWLRYFQQEPNVPFFNNNRTDVEAGRVVVSAARSWSSPVTYRLVADVYSPITRQVPNQKTEAFNGERLTISIPAAGSQPHGTITVNGALVSFRIGDSVLAAGLKLLEVKKNTAETIYEYFLETK